MLELFFIELAVVLVLATFLGVVFSKFKQPTILAFIVSGIILGASFLNFIAHGEFLLIFSELGIAFLLFLVGLNLDFGVFKQIGKTSIITGIGQIVFTSGVGIVIATFLGFGIIEALYIAVALTFSSTIIIVKLLSDKKELNALYGKISIGFLIVQDFAAVIILVLISSLSFSSDFSSQILQFFLGLIALFVVFVIAKKFLSRKIFALFSKNQELLFLGAISWCLVFASIAILLGFSKEIGAFLAGVSLSSLSFNHEIMGKLKYLRDFFIVLFFVVLGSNLVLTLSHAILIPAIIFSLFVLIGNPIIVFILMAKLGYKGRTSFLSSLAVAQISEFSLIIIFLGQKTINPITGLPHVSNDVVAIITLVAVMTIAFSSYLIVYNNKIYNKLSNLLPILRSKRFFEDSLHKVQSKKYDIVCLGFDEVGQKTISKQKKEGVLIVDFDPQAIANAKQEGFDALYGDISDLETINFILNVEPKVIISTIMDVHTNICLSKQLSEKKSKTKMIVLVQETFNAKKLKKAGIEFVLVPSIIAAKKVEVILDDIKKGNTFELKWINDDKFDL